MLRNNLELVRDQIWNQGENRESVFKERREKEIKKLIVVYNIKLSVLLKSQINQALIKHYWLC